MSDTCNCRELEWRIKRCINLHTQTACQLANTEADLVEAKKTIRQLEARIKELETPREVSCN